MGIKRSDKVRELHRTEAAKLFLEGVSYRNIAATLKTRFPEHIVSLNTVYEDIQALRSEWRETRLTALDEATAIELAKLDRVEEVAWQAFWQSKTIRVVRNKQRGRPRRLDPTDQNSAVTMETEGAETWTQEQESPGDPRFLLIVTQCIEKRAKLLGIYFEPSGDDKPVGTGSTANFYAHIQYNIVGGLPPQITQEDELPDE